MDVESPSEDEDLEAKMYAMIHFVDGENTNYPEFGENLNGITNTHSVLFNNEENSNKRPTLKTTDEHCISKDANVDDSQKSLEILHRNGRQFKSNQNGASKESSNDRIVSIQKVPVEDTSKTKFIMTVSFKNDSKNEEQCDSISKTILKNQGSTDTSDVTCLVNTTPENSVNESEIINKKKLKPQTQKKNSDAISEESECTILIKNSAKRPNESVSNKMITTKKTKSPSLVPVSLPIKPKNRKKKGPSKSPKILTIDLNSSDDGSDVEVIPQPVVPINAIYIESSDDEVVEDAINKSMESAVVEEISSMSVSAEPGKPTVPSSKSPSNSNITSDKITCVSPVPSIISSISDEFILADCSNLNITSNENETSNLKFNFELHGEDLCDKLVKATPKKQSKKKSPSDVDAVMLDYTKTFEIQDAIKKLPTLITGVNTLVSPEHGEDTFATPKSKSKKKNSVTKSISYTVNNIDYVTPSLDVYESESSDFPESVVDVPVTFTPKRKKKSISYDNNESDSLVMANVIGIDNSSNLDSQTLGMKDTPPNDRVNKKKNSQKKKKNKIDSKNRSDDLESYIIFDSGADFDHIKLQREMPYGKDYWPIDLTDKLREKRFKKSQVICGFCNKPGHREDNCYSKPKKCAMCGFEGHRELRCPNKICLNCGSRNDMFTSDCRYCYKWKRFHCEICKGHGHPSDCCPDIWRRYHRTISNEIPLIEDKSRKNSSQLFCSGCTGRGHLINSCKEFISFSEFQIPSPYVFEYTPIYGDSIKKQIDNPGQGSDGNSHNQTPFKRKSANEYITSHGEELSEAISSIHENASTTKTIEGDDQTSSHILLSQESIARLNSDEGKEFIKSASSRYNISINQSKTDLGDILLLTGNIHEHENFQVEFKKWMNVSEVTIPSSPKCTLPKNKTAAVKFLVNCLNSLDNKDFGNPHNIHSNLQSLEKEYKKLSKYQNKIINKNKLQSLCSKINNSRQLLNKILIGQAGFSNGHLNIAKLRSIIVELKYSQSVVIESKMRKRIIDCYLPIFSETPRDDYSKLISQYTSNDVNSTPPKYISNKKKNHSKGTNQKKTLLDRIRITRRKLQDASRYTAGDPYAIIDSTHHLLNMCEQKIQNGQTSKDTFYNLKKITSRVDKYIFEAQ